jgi:cell division protein ZapA
MATVTVEVNGHVYAVGCEDGQEPHVEALAREFDVKVRDVAGQVGKVTELRLFLMAALVMADEAGDIKARLADCQEKLGRSQSDDALAEVRAARAIEAAAERIETLAAGLG